jgi:hypothetical protein
MFLVHPVSLVVLVLINQALMPLLLVPLVRPELIIVLLVNHLALLVQLLTIVLVDLIILIVDLVIPLHPVQPLQLLVL